MRLSLGRKKENKKIATKANARLITSDETNLLVLSEPSSGLVIFLPGVLSMGSSNIFLASLSAMVSLPSLSHCKRTKGTKNVSCFRAIRATQTSRAAIFSCVISGRIRCAKETWSPERSGKGGAAAK